MKEFFATLRQEKKARRNLFGAVFLVVVLVVVDQIVKVIASAALKGQVGHIFWDGIVQIEYAENRGAFLSLGAQLSDEARFWIFVCGVSLILLFCVYSLLQSVRDTLATFSFALVIAGGIGNLIDRVLRGSVIDYIHMGFGNLRTGVFNVADVAITTGLVLLIYLQYVTGKKETTS